MGSFYQLLHVPEKLSCSRCGEERNSISQTDGQEDGRIAFVVSGEQDGESVSSSRNVKMSFLLPG